MFSTVIYQIFIGIGYFLNIVSFLLFVYCLMTWFVRPDAPIYVFIRRLVDPIVSPFRPLADRLIKNGFMIDLSVFMAIIAVQVLKSLLLRFILPLLMRL